MLRWHYRSVDKGVVMILKRAAGLNHENGAFDSLMRLKPKWLNA